MRYNFVILFLFIFITSCGFKIVNNISNYRILEVNTSGDNKTNFVLKNRLLISSNNESKNLIKLDIFTDKTKSIKEKNISNQVTKYEIKIDTKIKYSFVKRNLSNEFTNTKIGSYNVSTRHSETLDNERNLIKLLVEDLSQDILDKFSLELNDL